MQKPNLPKIDRARLRAMAAALNKALRPPVPVLLLLIAGCGAALVWVLAGGRGESLWAVPLYLLSAYTLVAFCLRAAGWARAIDRAVEQNRLTHALRHSETLRTVVQLVSGLFGALADAATKLYGGVRYGSGWLLAAGYYNLVLTALQLLLLWDLGRRRLDYRGQLRHYRLCGQLLCAATVPLVVMLVQIVREGGDAGYSQIYMIWNALVTFYALIKSVVHLVGDRSLAEPLLAAADCLDYATALVGVLSLQVMMFAVFGQGFAWQTLMNLLTGVGVQLLVISIAVYMLRRSRRELNKLDEAENK